MGEFRGLTAFGRAIQMPLDASAEASGGARQVFLVEGDGTSHTTAEIAIEPPDCSLRGNEAKFEDAFLSMHPFKCLASSKKHWCRSVYLFETARDPSFNRFDLK